VLFGPATSVYAELHISDFGSGLDDDVFVALTHARAVRSHLWGSWRQSAPGPRYRVTGTGATYLGVPDMDTQEDRLLAGNSPANQGDWGVDPEDRWGRLVRDGNSELLPSERGAWDTFYPAFAAAVRGEAPVPVDPWDAVATAETLDAARRSAETGQVVVLASEPLG
jgi:predicted dehydrogenase